LRWYVIILIGIAFTSVSLAGAATGPADLTFKVDSTADLIDAKLGDGKRGVERQVHLRRVERGQLDEVDRPAGRPRGRDYNLELDAGGCRDSTRKAATSTCSLTTRPRPR
jgi:hypothetical protein